MTADELDALTGAALWGVGDRVLGEGYAPGGEAGEREIGEDGGMGNPARLVVIVVSVIVLAASAKKRPFTPGRGSGGAAALDVAQRIFVERGVTVASKDKDAGLLVTAWNERGTPPTGRTRWMVTVDGGTFTVVMQCQIRPMGDWGGLKDWTECEDYEPSMSSEAASIAVEIEQRLSGEPVERPAPKTEVCFEVSGEPAHCFATWDECNTERDKRSGPNTGRCEAR